MFYGTLCERQFKKKNCKIYEIYVGYDRSRHDLARYNDRQSGFASKISKKNFSSNLRNEPAEHLPYDVYAIPYIIPFLEFQLTCTNTFNPKVNSTFFRMTGLNNRHLTINVNSKITIFNIYYGKKNTIYCKNDQYNEHIFLNEV